MFQMTYVETRLRNTDIVGCSRRRNKPSQLFVSYSASSCRSNRNPLVAYNRGHQTITAREVVLSGPPLQSTELQYRRQKTGLGPVKRIASNAGHCFLPFVLTNCIVLNIQRWFSRLPVALCIRPLTTD